MSVNVPLLRKCMEHITAHPDEHNQDEWAIRTRCGTAHCVAGWALVFAGREFDWAYQLGGVTRGVVRGKRTTAGAAAKDLGLTPNQARDLFHGDNTLSELWDLVEEFTGGELRRPPG